MDKGLVNQVLSCFVVFGKGKRSKTLLTSFDGAGSREAGVSPNSLESRITDSKAMSLTLSQGDFLPLIRIADPLSRNPWFASK
jgi:hypothetical protein